MNSTISIGMQDFGKLIRSGAFYVDKTSFIKEWWENQDDVTLVTRPRRFGKTLNLSMVDYFSPISMRIPESCLRIWISGRKRNIRIYRERSL